MTFIDWMNMNMAVDISFLVFAVAVVWKFIKIQKKLKRVEDDLAITMKNPAAAKRLLKERS